MKRDSLNDLSKTLLHDAEDACAESDPEMCEAAGMVLVGDVYALLVSLGDGPRGDAHTPQPEGEDDELEPFIR